MLERPSEKDQIRLLIKNLQPRYFEPLKYQAITSYTQLHDVGVLIEDDYLSNKGKAKVSYNHNTSNYKEKKTASAAQEVHAITPETTNGRRAPRQYTPLGMTYSQAFEHLVKSKHLEPIGPTDEPPTEKKSKYWDANTYCKYHRGNGHKTETCFRLQDAIQDLVDSGAIAVPKAPNIQSNPLGATFCVSEDIQEFDPSSWITHVGHPTPLYPENFFDKQVMSLWCVEEWQYEDDYDLDFGDLEFDQDMADMPIPEWWTEPYKPPFDFDAYSREEITEILMAKGYEYVPLKPETDEAREA